MTPQEIRLETTRVKTVPEDMKVLIVDDSPLICLRLAALLSDVEGVEIAGYTTDSALVISSVMSLKPDVVILDIQLGGASGIDFLRQIRRDHPGIVVVMLTNLADPRYRKTCLEAGAAFFFDKSTPIFELAGAFFAPFPAREQPAA